jgi:hypothetical protein
MKRRVFNSLGIPDSLYVRLFLPYTRFPAMAVYRTTILPLPVAGHQLTTEL